jgi:DNA-binding MarR family transcriptional regulator
LRFRTLAARLARIFKTPPCRSVDPPLRESGITLAALMIEAIRQREAEGCTTTLRQLHCLLDISQPTALRLAHLLAREGVVRIEENLSDRFESAICLSPGTRDLFSEMRYANNADSVA